jgi:hypothetical protein
MNHDSKVLQEKSAFRFEAVQSPSGSRKVPANIFITSNAAPAFKYQRREAACIRFAHLNLEVIFTRAYHYSDYMAPHFSPFAWLGSAGGYSINLIKVLSTWSHML